MADGRDPEATLEEWKESMQAEHAEAIENPDPEEAHEIEGVAQVSYRVTFEYDEENEVLVRDEREQVDELNDPELLSCACGVRGMTHEEALTHLRNAR
ncbi:hypothetical protein [Halapricum salinum]|uniref:Uncharacterized protein n=1 Tax=Halapricum salinum TaxID=1457250 RepID=A0A4D6HCD9_9EURY|nr:hypothetical protein [Halapricum salinum]QCC50387.1 hypothetical protein DV733_03670 [Halapricum salinum]